MKENNTTQQRIEDARTLLEDISARLTPQREAVLKALLANPTGHHNAEEVLHAARIYLPDLGIATVYRTLELFTRLGIIRKLDTAEGQSRFEYNADTNHYHHHMICLSCGKIMEFNEDLLESVETQVTRSTGFQVVDHCLQFYGYCISCAKTKPEAGS
jgi:Fur family ferric uptake transcriptional regulator